MNYLTEIKLFYDWLETHDLNPRAIALWHGLLYIANRSGWQSQLPISIATIEARTHIPRTSIYRERDQLSKHGLVSYEVQGSRHRTIYTIHSFEMGLAFQNASQVASRFGTQNGMREVSFDGFASQDASQFGTHSGNIYKLDYTEINKEKSKKEIDTENDNGRERKSCAKKKEPKSAVDVEAVLATIEPPWAELMRGWLEYKRLRRENYRSEIGVAKCLSLLRHLSGDDPKTAATIIDQSFANNWAGLFELKRSSYGARGQPGQPPQPATGQHIGQIKQPDSEERTRKLLEKFNEKQ